MMELIITLRKPVASKTEAETLIQIVKQNIINLTDVTMSAQTNEPLSTE